MAVIIAQCRADREAMSVEAAVHRSGSTGLKKCLCGRRKLDRHRDGCLQKTEEMLKGEAVTLSWVRPSARDAAKLLVGVSRQIDEFVT